MEVPLYTEGRYRGTGTVLTHYYHSIPLSAVNSISTTSPYEPAQLSVSCCKIDSNVP
jgi:hypothetical protein